MQTETLTPVQRGMARKKRRMERHAAAKRSHRHRRKVGVRIYSVPLKTAEAEEWLRSIGRISVSGAVGKAEIEAAILSILVEAIAESRSR